MDYVFFLGDNIITYSLQEIIHSEIMKVGDTSHIASGIHDLIHHAEKKEESTFFIGASGECPIISSIVEIIKYINNDNKIILCRNGQPEYLFKYIKCDFILDLNGTLSEIKIALNKAINISSNFDAIRRKRHLSPKEMLVLKYLSTGRSNKEVSKLLCLSEKTISCHKQTILRKLNIKTIDSALSRM